jgi:diguanylate cyclase (GGDEF)-like protein
MTASSESATEAGSPTTAATATLLEHAFEAVAILDDPGPEGRVRYANPVLDELLGRPPGWTLGRTRAELEYGPVIAGADVARLVRRDGTFVDCRVRCVTLTDDRHGLYYLPMMPAAPVATPAWALASERGGLRTLEHVLEALRRDWSVAQRTRARVALVRIKVDAWEPFIEVFGRIAGENTLRQIGNVIAAALRRSSDAVARSGEGEFLLLAAAMEPETLDAHVESILGRVRSLSIHHPRSTSGRYLSISAGAVAAIPPNDAGSDWLLEATVRAMRDAQAKGGNRVVSGSL